MSKSFCNGCKHWQRIEGAREYNEYFMVCIKFHIWETDLKKKMCNGKYKENKV